MDTTWLILFVSVVISTTLSSIVAFGFLLLSRRKLAGTLQSRLREAEHTIATLGSELKTCQAELQTVRREAEEHGGTALVETMNASDHGRVLRLARSGQSPEVIASRLNVPLGEVDLLLKIQKMAGEAAYALQGRQTVLEG